MIAWLLARPRLIAYGLAGAALAGGVAWAVHDVRSAYAARAALPIAIADAAKARAEKAQSEKSVTDQIAANQRIERETNEALRRAGAAAHDLAGRLRQYQAMRRPVCPAPAAPGEPHATGPQPGDRAAIERGFERVEQATEAHLVAAGEDAEFLTGLQTYVRGLPKRCVPD